MLNYFITFVLTAYTVVSSLVGVHCQATTTQWKTSAAPLINTNNNNSAQNITSYRSANQTQNQPPITPAGLSHCPQPNITNNYTTFVVVKNNSSAFHKESEESSFEEGAEIKYRCKDEKNYQLVGYPQRICLLNKWIDDQNLDDILSPPRCLARRNCSAPAVPKGMFVQIDGKNVTITNETYYAAGTVAVYKCISDSHSLLVNATGGSREHSRTCDTVSANWTGAIPTKCEATCQSLPISDGDVTYSTAVLPGGRYLIGTEAFLYCGIVFNRENTTTTTIKDSNSTWSKVCHSNDTWIDRHKCALIDDDVLAHIYDIAKAAKIIAWSIALFVVLLGLLMLCLIYRKRSEEGRPNYREMPRALNTSRTEFYSFDNATTSEREYATIHRLGRQSPGQRRPLLNVAYVK